jgi:hypothetical protein
VDVQPGDADRVRILLIKPQMTPGQPLSGLTYQVNGKGSKITLDNAQFLIGGTLSLLPEAPHTMTFANAQAAPVVVEIVVGRLATPPPPEPAIPDPAVADAGAGGGVGEGGAGGGGAAGDGASHGTTTSSGAGGAVTDAAATSTATRDEGP